MDESCCSDEGIQLSNSGRQMERCGTLCDLKIDGQDSPGKGNQYVIA